MKKKIAFIAVGQAGGNIGQLFEQKGFSVLYINTSREDLDTLESAKFKYHIPAGEGCNKDRRKAKQLVVDDFDQIAGEIESKLKADMFFVIFASGGGTGSGAGPMLTDLLIDEGRTVGVVTVIPSPEESVKAQINSYECFTELMEIEKTASCFILDNQRGEKMGLNEEFTESFCTFLDIPSRHKSVRGNVDKAEILETLKAHGMAVVVHQEANESAEVIQALGENCYAAVESDRAVKYIAASMSGQVCMKDLEKAIGVPVDNFQTFNDRETVVCVSGLSYPKTRLEVVFDKVSENEEQIRKNLAAAKDCSMRKGINFLSELEQDRKEPEKKKPQSKRDIMRKYL